MRHCYLPYKSVRNAWDGNWRALRRSRKDYFAAIDAALAHSGILRFRWHVGGDIPDADYLHRMADLAVRRHEVRFWCTTKRYGLAKSVREARGGLPENLCVHVSLWPGVEFPEEEIELWPTAWMRDPKNPDPRIPARAFECPGHCDKCGRCWRMKAGQAVVFERH
jgi:hypothetical protein